MNGRLNAYMERGVRTAASEAADIIRVRAAPRQHDRSKTRTISVFLAARVKFLAVVPHAHLRCKP
jgi:hypothetical protein